MDPLNFDGNTEACDGQDNDCNGLDDAGAAGVDDQESDGDGDGQWECQGDCDDADPANFGGNADAACDGLDTDCVYDGDEVDDDGDGQFECQGDCDDADAANFAGNLEAACDGLDTDCVYDGDEVDDDGDGQFECQGDCDDTDPLNFALNPEVCDGQDNDCNGLDDSGAAGVGGQESDADGDGQWECQGDCDDGDDSIFSGNWLDLNSDLVDSNCDGVDWFSLAGADAGFVGESGLDNSGYSVSSAGDVDGDGLDDLLIGAPDYNQNDPGKTYLIFGSAIAAGGTFGLSLADAVFVGETAADSSGYSVAGAGDVDGDGLDDLLIGAPNNADGGAFAGKSYLFFGSTVSLGGTFNLSSADATFVGEDSVDYSGCSVSAAGDVDADGLSDLLIGAWNAAITGNGGGLTYLFLGSTVASGGTFDLSLADVTFSGGVGNGRSGSAVASAGDVDGDGRGDILIGDWANDIGGSGAGMSYLFLGSTIAAGGTFSLGAADAAFMGEGTGDRSGHSVSSAGDVDGDGLDDLLIGAPHNAEAGTIAGKSYLFLGSTVAPGGTFDLSLADASWVGESIGGQSGQSVSSAGDVDGDGLDDLIVGAPDDNKSYLLLGSTFVAGGSFNLSTADAAFWGEVWLDRSGWSVASAGDVDGDGRDDLLIGAYRNDEGTIDAGKTYLLISPL